MASTDSVRAVIQRHFQHVQDLGGGVVRGERRYNDKPYAVAYIDLSDSVVERSHNLEKFQESLLGPDFFSTEGDLRWNSYLYFLAGPKSTASGEFGTAKAQIESDRHFARKFVLDEQDLARRLGERQQVELRDPAKSVDAGGTWAELLRAASLSVLLEQRPRTTTLDLIASGDAFKAEAALPPPKTPLQPDALAKGLLRKLTIGSFRRVNKGQSFAFGDVNLIVGANGTGKTSLLEAIEVLYCGRVRRDPDANFSGITAEVEMEQGQLVTIKAPAAIATLKARNMSWYGRADVQSNAISQGFTRFNFLDTDAAFRLSAEQSNEQIKLDFGRLLVGPETSKLWTYLSRLEEEVSARLKSLDDRLPSERRHVELLADEVKRYKDAPSEANTLLRQFRSRVTDLGPKWEQIGEESALIPNERARLEALLKTISQLLTAIPETPVTINRIKLRVTQLQDVLEAVKKLELEHEAALKQVSQASSQADGTQRGMRQLEEWTKLVEAGVPALARKLLEVEAKIVNYRAALGAQPVDSSLEVPREYAHLRIQDGLQMARTKHDEARQQESAAALALSQRLQLGQTLAMLRRDLHDASIAFIEQSGDAVTCPVCGTPHGPGELLGKLEKLITADGSSAPDSLRHNVQLAKERVEQARRAAEFVASLESFRQSNVSSTALTVEEIHRELLAKREELRVATSEVEAIKRSTEALDLLGLKWSSWAQTRDATIPLLAAGTDPGDAEVVRAALSAMKDRADADATAQLNARDAVTSLVAASNQIATGHLLLPATNLAPAQVVAAIERLSGQVKSALSAAEEVSKSVQLNADAEIEELQRKVEASLVAFDKALHALNSDEQAKQDLKKKDEELQIATRTLAGNSSAREHLARAKETLSALVAEHSLDRATADAFNAIRGKVSDVFAQIHSPPEYEIGNLNEGQLIVRRDNKETRDANQVSTGQRAALALSIFLALNDSAKTAPPVILIDDPVAHIDDLNALNFLDYLREVAVGSRKQVFFATADIRLAALFQRKFEFLGSKRFKRILLTQKEGVKS